VDITLKNSFLHVKRTLILYFGPFFFFSLVHQFLHQLEFHWSTNLPTNFSGVPTNYFREPILAGYTRIICSFFIILFFYLFCLLSFVNKLRRMPSSILLFFVIQIYSFSLSQTEHNQQMIMPAAVRTSGMLQEWIFPRLFPSEC